MTSIADDIRAAALLAACDKMTPHGVFHFHQPFSNADAMMCWLSDLATNTKDAALDLHGVGSGDPDGSWVVTALTGNGPDREANAAGYAALKNYAPALIRELLAENERLEAVREATARMCMDEQDENERLRARVAELEARLALNEIQAFDHEHLRDAGPTPFQGRSTRRDTNDV